LKEFNYKKKRNFLWVAFFFTNYFFWAAISAPLRGQSSAKALLLLCLCSRFFANLPKLFPSQN